MNGRNKKRKKKQQLQQTERTKLISMWMQLSTTNTHGTCKVVGAHEARSRNHYDYYYE